MTNPKRGLRTGKTAATSENGLNGASAVELFELTLQLGGSK